MAKNGEKYQIENFVTFFSVIQKRNVVQWICLRDLITNLFVLDVELIWKIELGCYISILYIVYIDVRIQG